jgi:hypothetical protein
MEISRATAFLGQIICGFQIGGKFPWPHLTQFGAWPAAVAAKGQYRPAQVV